MRKRGPIILGVTAITLFLGALIYGSFSVVQAECELCVEFNGMRECRTGSGTNAEEARQAAQRAACAVMAQGMDATIACGNRQPEVRRCQT
jgi:hypothetical protein